MSIIIGLDYFMNDFSLSAVTSKSVIASCISAMNRNKESNLKRTGVTVTS